ncbi:MAG: S8/S53 family peptidase, partial [Methylococcales bacterium]
IMSKQTASSDTNAPLPRLWGTYLDIDQAMTILANASRANVGMGDHVTVSLSVGGGILTGADCPMADDVFYWTVEMLHSLNIPVVAATGNEGSNSAILWPACTPKVIKVAGTILKNGNDSFWRGSNIVNPATSNSPFFLAPACVVSSGLNSGPTGGHSDPYCGTSASTPHVAGLYALIKQAAPGITVDQATAWILDYASNPVQTGYGYAVQSIKLPPL